ncbi:MAG: DUF5320 domain-containing protein [Deltaproteobacteria bacterium]|nr:DUF5320 domain-containing protein [Deltaproteobacteria bacterium]
MPGLNGKGPQGEGPLTGRGLGRCRPTATDATDQRRSGDQLRKIDPNNYNSNTVATGDNVVYGRGQGGLPRGGGACQAFGRGFGGPGAGGGRGLGRGAGQGTGRGRRR